MNMTKYSINRVLAPNIDWIFTRGLNSRCVLTHLFLYNVAMDQVYVFWVDILWCTSSAYYHEQTLRNKDEKIKYNLCGIK